ncbi:GIY-YIG nuclease family protein [Sphingomonas sp. Ant20]|uniref:GIY-YIG nuclease family protein n=1 Tax=Sphingomonas sp. Ant20 TaxID=104605 RepID=UPI00068C3C2D|nr:GIY-YIG nuclease family protein [Sphingomonas sp. Ant20]
MAEPLTRAPHYQGPLADVPPQVAAAQLSELLAYFGFDCAGAALPGPVAGLPRDATGDADRNVLAAMRSGIVYLHGLATRRARQQVAAYAAAEDLLLPIVEEIFEQRRHAVIAEADAQARAARVEIEEEAKRGRRAALVQQVYFIAADDGPIKIGVAKDPVKRLAALQVSYPTRLALLATTDGGFYQERRYHSRFEQHRLHGEWFRRCPAITSEIARLNKVVAA